MTIPGDIIIPALTFRTSAGDLDEATTARYAETAAGTWLDYFILSGTTTEGDTFTVDERAQVLDIWLKTTDKSRLVACCWTRADIDAALERGIRPMAVMRGLRDEDEAIAFFRTLPAGAFVYSHPMHTSQALTSSLVLRALQLDCLPAGAKISKILPRDLSTIREAAGARFILWDGSCRRARESLQIANGVVATPFACLEIPGARPGIDGLSEALVVYQAGIDAIPAQHPRAEWLRNIFKKTAIT